MKLACTIFLIAICSNGYGQTLKRAEYFFDSDPGKGNGTSLSITQAASINQTFNISISSLSSGTHTFNIRFVDSNGHWSLFDSRSFFVLNASAALTASTLKKVEYFFDNDPGIGNGTPISISASGTQNNTFIIGLGSLTQGFHQLAIRYQDNLGRWSLFANRTFYIVSPSAATASTTIKKAEYFFDNDPGVGKGSPLAITSANPQNNLFAININGLTSGFHQLAIRYQDNAGKWSLFANRTFYIVPNANATLATSINKAEYFFDNDPGVGKGTAYPIASGSPQNNLFAINISGLPSGFHQLCLRYQDNLGRWSVFTNRTFYIVPNANAALASSIKKAEYFFDNDPSVGQGTNYPITTGNPQNDILAININGLSSGFHQLCLRVQDNLGRWSTFAKRTFYIVPGGVLSTNLQKLEYFVDTDPGFDKGKDLAFTPAAQVNQPFSIDLSGVPSGNHVLLVRAKDSGGYWSTVVSATFTIQSCIPPSAPLGVDGSRCNSGSVTLAATGATGGQQYHWYVDNVTTSILFTGSSYSTPSLTVNTDYYVSIYDPSTGCESNRTKVSASVSGLSKPTINPGGSLTLCAGNTITLTAPPGFLNYTWSNGASSQQITVSTSGSYSVAVGDGTCTSPVSDPFILTVVPKPAKPIVQVTGNTTICGSGSALLSAPTGASGYLWSDGSTTQQITAGAAGNYSVQITDSNNCQSQPSDPTGVQLVAVPGKPVIKTSGPAALCNNSLVTLSAPQGFANYQWSSGATSADIVVANAGSYTVTVGNGTCTSVASDPVVVTVATPPAKPVIQVQGSTTICGSGSVLLTAPGASSYLWSDGSNSQQVIATAAGKYSVQITDVNNCKSVLSDEVAIKVVAIPPIPSIKVFGSTNLCLNGTVILAAPSGFLNYRWSNGDTTAAVLLSTAGNYSVTVGNAPTCLSAASLPAIVTLTNEPCTGGPGPNDVPPSIANATINIPVGTEISFGLKNLIKKGTVGVNLSSLRIVLSPASGAKATLNSADSLIVDFRGSSFVGRDSIGIQVCDSLGSCTQRTLSIDVVADVEVFNAVSPFPDNINDFFNLKYIDKIEDTKKNSVTIVDRWGNEVFSISDYNNVDRVFKGLDNAGRDLPSGTYYYRVDFPSGRPILTGFISLKR